MVLEGQKVGFVWEDGLIWIPGKEHPLKLVDSEVDSWTSFLKIGKNRFAVSGLIESTGPYTQVIKVVDDNLNIHQTLKYELGATEDPEDAGIVNLFHAGPKIVIGNSRRVYIHIFRSNGYRLFLFKTNIKVFPDEEDVFNCRPKVFDDKTRIFMGTYVKKMAIVKLLF